MSFRAVHAAAKKRQRTVFRRSLAFALCFFVILSFGALAWEGSEVVGTLAQPLKMSGGLTEDKYWTAYDTECSLGSATADAVRLAAGADAALLAGGDLAVNLWSGEVTWDAIEAAYTPDREVVLARVTPRQLRELIEYGISRVVLDAEEKIDREASSFEGFPQISGFKLQYDVSAPVGERVMSIILDNEAVLDLDDDETLLTLAATEYMLNGGYGYPVTEHTDAGFDLAGAMAEYVAAGVTAEYKDGSDRLSVFGSSAEGSLYSLLPAGLVFVLIAIFLLGNRSRLKKYHNFER